MTEPRARRYDLWLPQTPAQTLGPFFHQGLLRTRESLRLPATGSHERAFIGNVIAAAGVPGQRIRLRGAVYDGAAEPVSDALLELWQADGEGRYSHPLDAAGGASGSGFHGFGRAATDTRGAYGFETIKPGRVRWSGGGTQAPHLNLIIGARGMMRHAFTRVYFAGDNGLDADPVLSRVPEARRRTLLARPDGERDGVLLFEFDVRLQGEDETVFFEI
jgi:protocatechuate 3,4-dioxygenase alpha subunit